MFTINVKGKENPKDKQMVKLEMIFFKTGYARVTKMLNVSGEFKDWDNDAQKFKPRTSEALDKNKRILEQKTSYLKIAEEWQDTGDAWTPVEWSHCFDEQTKKSNEIKVLTVAQMITLQIDRLKNKERLKNGKVLTSVSTAKSYHDLERSLNTFTKQKYGKSLSSYFFKHITAEFVDDYVFFLQKMGADNGNEACFRTRMRKFYGVVYFATKMEIPGADLSIFTHIRPKMKPKQFVPRTLPLEVFAKIENIDRSLFTGLEQFYIDLFLFSYYTGGMASIDVAYLTWDCIKDNMIIYERIKFPKQAQMPFIDKAKDITKRYKDKCYDNFVLPVFTHKHKTEAQQRGRLERLCRGVNATLQKVRKIVKYKEKITWYAARGTFITRMINADYHPIDVAQMAGNSPQSIYQHYYKNTKTKEILKKLNSMF